MSAAECAVCGCAIVEGVTGKTTVRRANGDVRFVMCNLCFDHRFCAECLIYFSSIADRMEHRCPN